MKKRIATLMVGVAALLFTAQSVIAAGFALYEWSARGNALGGAMVGRADDISALAYNPAGLTQLGEGIHVQTGVSAIVPNVDVNVKDPYSNTISENRGKHNVWLPPHLYVGGQVADNLWAGLGTFSRYGLGTELDSEWTGRYFGYQSFVHSLSINPNVAFKITDKLSMGLGMEINWLDVDLRKYIDGTMFVYAADPVNAPAQLAALGLSPTVNDPSTDALDVDNKITGDSYGLGFNLALHYKINDQWSAGVSYRSPIKQSVDGRADFEPSDTAKAIFGDALFQDCGASGSIILPDMLSFGLMYKPYDNFSIEVGAMWTRWSQYRKLEFNFDRLDAIGRPSSGEAKRWNDVWRFMVGVEYSPLDWLTLRLGYDYDQSPIEEGYEDYRLPSNDRHLFNSGLGFRFGDFTLDLSYTYLMIQDRDVDARQDDFGFPELYESSYENGDAHIYGVTFGYVF